MANNLNRSLPLYRIIYDHIVQRIYDESYKIGDKLPSEYELEKKFQTSRTPVRQALKQLESDGFIYRLQGLGTFVANYKPIGQWTTMTGFKDIYFNKWKNVSARTIEVTRKISHIYSNLLEVKNNSELLHLKRIRFFNNEPVIYLEHYLIPELPIEIFRKDYTFISIDQLLKEKKDIELTNVKEEIEAISAYDSVAKVLKINNNVPILKSTRISYDFNSTPVDITVNYFQTDKWKYMIEFNKNKS